MSRNGCSRAGSTPCSSRSCSRLGPLLAMIGEKGSGKTSVLRRIGQLLFGPKFQVMGMSHEPKDFDAAVTSEAFVVIDNADANVPWLDDKLAVVATGGTLKRQAVLHHEPDGGVSNHRIRRHHLAHAAFPPRGRG